MPESNSFPHSKTSYKRKYIFSDMRSSKSTRKISPNMSQSTSEIT